MRVHLSRRDFTRASGLAFVSALCCDVMAVNRAEDKRPNLLIIHTDEHNFRTLGCYRDNLPEDQAFVWGKDAVVETPHIDWLADNGAICLNCYASTPVCSPSRASFVSGLYPQNTDTVNNNIPMRDDLRTFAGILSEHGWSTGYAGKWHLDGGGKPQWEPKRKFGFQDNRFMFNRGHWKVFHDTPGGPKIKSVNTKGKPSYSVKGADEKSFATDWLADKAIDFMKTNQSKPFCYMVSIPDPHGPDSVRAPYDTQYSSMTFEPPQTSKKSLDGVPSWAMPAKRCGFKQSNYFGMVKCIDDNVGRILKYLKDNKLLKSTIVVFTADHGDLRGEHGRHNKGVPLEASAKIPFVLYYPAKVKAGTKIKASMGTVDFMPTILALMDVKDSCRKDGRDYSCFFEGGDTTGWNDITFMRSTGDAEAKSGWLSAVTARYKLVLSVVDDPWLIDLQKDPDELKNFWDNPEYSTTRARLSKALSNYGKTYKDKRIEHSNIAKYM